jgi:hypothetical protein
MVHTGKLEPDWENDVWCDTDPTLHDVTEFELEMPWEFKWSCCNGLGNSKGCKK